MEPTWPIASLSRHIWIWALQTPAIAGYTSFKKESCFGFVTMAFFNRNSLQFYWFPLLQHIFFLSFVLQSNKYISHPALTNPLRIAWLLTYTRSTFVIFNISKGCKSDRLMSCLLPIFDYNPLMDEGRFWIWHSSAWDTVRNCKGKECSATTYRISFL